MSEGIKELSWYRKACDNAVAVINSFSFTNSPRKPLSDLFNFVCYRRSNSLSQCMLLMTLYKKVPYKATRHIINYKLM